jgi:hypothetical protein
MEFSDRIYRFVLNVTRKRAGRVTFISKLLFCDTEFSNKRLPWLPYSVPTSAVLRIESAV